MASLADIRAALAANLAGIDGLQESAYILAQPTPPAAEVMPGPVEYDRAFQRGLDDWTFTVRVFVGLTSDIGAQKRLDRMLASSGDDSVKEQLESDRTLGGAAEDLHVRRTTGYRIYAREGSGPVLGAEWDVQVLARGDT